MPGFDESDVDMDEAIHQEEGHHAGWDQFHEEFMGPDMFEFSHGGTGDITPHGQADQEGISGASSDAGVVCRDAVTSSPMSTRNKAPEFHLSLSPRAPT